MKHRLTLASVMSAGLAAPVMAHEGHATLPGAEGHAEAHLVMVAVAVALVWLVVKTVKSRTSKRQEE